MATPNTHQLVQHLVIVAVDHTHRQRVPLRILEDRD